MGLGGSKDKEPEPEDAAPAPPAEAPVTRPKPKMIGGSTTIMNMGDLLFLNTIVPLVPRATMWSAVYLSHRDGKSFTKLVHSIRNMKNTLILVKDDGGHIFGIFCGDKWKDPSDLEEEYVKEKANAARERRLGRKYEPKKSTADTNFFGTGDCALIAVQPDQAIYRPTRINENFMYLQTSWPEQDLNGLALGGLPGLFGVQLDSFLDSGKFRGANGKCMTFNNPCLAHKPDFEIREVEVWVLGGEEVAGNVCTREGIMENAEGRKDQQILELAGKKFYSSQDYDE
eukprot:TRINITY_DN46266_c0_g1_i1.p3 TRINITY_DN46266_c0_g1~~TRINITY_DN46266_c0_g1_i1.p3  ORF type:complete len:285 (+),score=115.87 TRINITY_DN46266_c0_g1_i1:247-1101(+)